MTKSLQSKPEIKQELLLFWDAFTTLSASRSYSLRFGKKDTQYIGPDPILFSEIVKYSDAIMITDIEQRMRMVRIIQRVDAAFIEETKNG